MEQEPDLKDKLSFLLTAAILKSEKMNNGLDINSFKVAINILKQEQSIYQLVPTEITVPIERLQETEDKAKSIVGLMKDMVTNRGLKNEDMIHFYPSKGILLFDGLHSAAFGRMSYIYRSKGTRVYLFEDSTIDIVTPYSTIDHNGFEFQNESYFDQPVQTESIQSVESFPELFDSLNNFPDNQQSTENENIPLRMIQMIANIKQPFYKDYFLEYLLLPPDVDKLSTFSLNIQSILWEICLSQSFQKEVGEKQVNKAIELLISINILPNPILIINIIQKGTDENMKAIIEKLNAIEKLANKKKDIFTPQISTPIGTINLDAIREWSKGKIL